MANKSLRFIIKISLCIILCAVSVVNTFAWTDVGPFAYWYSNDSGVGYMTGNPIYVYPKLNGTGMTSSSLTYYANTAKNAWSDSEGPFVTGNSDNYNIRIQDITRATANSDGVTANANAYTYYTPTLVGRGTVAGTSSVKSVYRIDTAEICLIYDSTTMQYSTSKWRAITAHEMGHALGYMGHDVNSTASNPSLMYPSSSKYWDVWQINAPTTRDLRHMNNA